MARTAALIAAAMVAIAAGGYALRSVADDLATPRDLHGEAHATSDTCRSCHPGQHATWSETFHRTMTQAATEAAVQGDWNDAELRYGGVTATFSRGDDGAFIVRFAGPDGYREEARVVRTVGSRRYQQLLAADGDQLLRLPVAWHVGEQRWFHMNGAFLFPDPPFDGRQVGVADYHRHVTRWNDNCVFCHNVAPNPGLDREAQAFATEVAELGVACEACHGPAAEHVAANRNPLRRYAVHLSGAADPTIVHPGRLDAARSAEVCGRCHGQRIAADVEPFLTHGDPFVPGDELSEYSRPLGRDTTLQGQPGVFADRFWADGTPRLTAYEYQGLLQSPCEGLTCTTCHGMHEGDPRGQLRPAATGDGACAGCHDDVIAEATTHSDHEDVRCVDCHMPRVVFGVLSIHRSHRIEVPDPARDAANGRPDACTLCHAERSRAWAMGEADGEPEMHRALLGGDPLTRAVAADALGRAPLSEEARAARLGLLLAALRDDPYPAVRRIAWRSARTLAPDGVDWMAVQPESMEPRDRFTTEAVERLGAVEPDAAWAERLRAEADDRALEIGE